MREQRISWSSDGSAAIRDVNALDSLLDKLDSEHGGEAPIIVTIDGPRTEQVYFGIGGDRSFVSSTQMPYFTTVGDLAAVGHVDYSFQGHHSPVARTQLISRELARKIVREFFATGELPSCQAWKPIGPD